jgi:hypothetical protein
MIVPMTIDGLHGSAASAVVVLSCGSTATRMRAAGHDVSPKALRMEMTEARRWESAEFAERRA